MFNMTPFKTVSELLPLAMLAVSCGQEPSASPGDADDSGTAALVRGTLTATDPIRVAGTVIDARAATIRIDDQTRRQGDLALGMLTTVRGTMSSDRLVATEVQAEHAVRGVVASRNGSMLFVGPQAVQLSPSTVVASVLGTADTIPIGALVRVFGQSAGDGTIRASRVDDNPGREDEEEFELEIKGFVSALSLAPEPSFDLTLTSGGDAAYHVTLAAGVSLPAGLTDGSFVEVKASEVTDLGALIAIRVELEDDFLGHDDHGGQSGEREDEDEDEHGIEVEVEGFVTSGNAAAFVVAGQEVITTATTLYVGGTAAEVLPGVKLSAEGTLNADAVLVARKIELEELVRLQGPVSELAAQDSRHGSFAVLGLRVLVNEATELRGERGEAMDLTLLGAQPVEVRAFIAANGLDLVAVRVGQTGDTRLIIESTVSAKDESTMSLTMLGITVVPAMSGDRHGGGDDGNGGEDDGSAAFSAIFPLIELESHGL
jgi:hypothetical protein